MMLSLAMVFFYAGCSSKQEKRIISSFAGGDPKQINYFRMEGKDTLWIRSEYLYQNGSKQLEGDLAANNTMNGTWTIWYEDGKKNAAAAFENGTRRGDWQVWDFNGDLLTAESYEMEVDPTGFPLVLRFYSGADTDRSMTGEIDFYPNHLKKTEGHVLDGKKHGLWKAWYKDGTKWSEGYFQHDLNHGRHTVWHENGQKFYEGDYIVGQRSGIWKFWAEDGRLLKETNYTELRNKMEQQKSE
jgi:antitoxin component YwqK of YwqJK toxin-antitoxin module